MKINSNEYFNEKIKKTFTIKVVKDINDKKSMLEYFKKFRLSKHNNKSLGLDFEFNSSPEGKKIALFQINLESDDENAMIYLFYPPDLDKNEIIELKDLLIDTNIKKILHGAEALDIPYLFKNIFVTNKNRNLFCKNLFDTRYMCEYLHLDRKLNEKCKIYSILLELKVINKNQYNMLLQNEEEMGPIYEIEIDVRNLDKNTMLYSAFDVLYLPNLLKKFPDDKIYMKLIPQITCFNFIDRYEDLFTKPFSDYMNKINNYFTKYKGENIKLIDIFNYYYYTMDGIILNLMEINYYKKFLETMVKFIIYKNIDQLHIIYQKSNVKANLTNDLKQLEKDFSKIILPDEFTNFFSELRRKLKNEIFK